MAFKVLNVTMNGSAQQLTTTHTPVCQVRMMTATGVADVKVGDKTLSSTVYGDVIAAGPAGAKAIVGPFGGGTSPVNLEEIYVLGTNNEVLRVIYITL